jgi:hypothetical protein
LCHEATCMIWGNISTGGSMSSHGYPADVPTIPVFTTVYLSPPCLLSVQWWNITWCCIYRITVMGLWFCKHHVSTHSFLANELDFGIISSPHHHSPDWTTLDLSLWIHVQPVLRTSPPWAAASHRIGSKGGRLRPIFHQIWEELYIGEAAAG